MSKKKSDNTAPDGSQAETRKALHDSISQIASIRLLAEIIILQAESKAPELKDDLNQLVDLTVEVQETLVDLMQRSRL